MIEIGNKTSAEALSNQSTLTFAHNSDTDFLVLSVLTFDAATSSSVAGTPTATYNGVAMTYIGGATNQTGDSQDAEVAMFYLANPAQGSNDVVVSVSPSNRMSASAASFSGVDVDDIVDDSTTAFTDSGSTFTLNTTTIADDSMMVSNIMQLGNFDITNSGGQTAIHSNLRNGGQPYRMNSSYKLAGAAGAQTMGGSSHPAATIWGGISFAFKALPAGGNNALAMSNF